MAAEDDRAPEHELAGLTQAIDEAQRRVTGMCQVIADASAKGWHEDADRHCQLLAVAEAHLDVLIAHRARLSVHQHGLAPPALAPDASLEADRPTAGRRDIDAIPP